MATAHIHAQKKGSGKVSDSQVAFMVECYLGDSHFSRTLQEFRSEAARLLHPLRAVPKGARSLSSVLNDYVSLKEEQISAAAEKARVEDLFHGLQEILSVYLAQAPTKKGTMVESKNESTVPTCSPLHVALPAATVDQPQLHGSIVSGGSNAFISTDQYSKEKSASSKRKNIHNANQQQGDSMAAKKSCRALNVQRRSTDPCHEGNSVNVDSPTGSIGNMVSNVTQPATPPMSTTNSSIMQQQQQQALPCQASSGSFQTSSPPTAIRSSLVSPKHVSITITPPSSFRGDCTQSNQGPQTPCPSSIKSSLSNVCATALTAANLKCNTGATTAQGIPRDEQQRQKAFVTKHLSSSACPYALRAHRKPGSEPPTTAFSDAKPSPPRRAIRKKDNNSKCRLLDFSSAAEEVGKHVSPLNEGNGVGITSSEGAEAATSNQQNGGTSEEGLIVSPQSGQVSDLSPSTQNSQESQSSEFALTCDTFSFDELFDLDLDTSLISEWENLAPCTGHDEGPPSCLKASDINALSPALQDAARGVLVDVGNFIHPDDATSVMQQCTNPLASPLKLRKPATGNESDKENMHAAAISSSPLTILTT